MVFFKKNFCRNNEKNLAGKWFYEKKNFVAIMENIFVATIFFPSITGWFCRNNLRFGCNYGFGDGISNQLSRCFNIKCIFGNKSNNFRNRRLWQRECHSNQNRPATKGHERWYNDFYEIGFRKIIFVITMKSLNQRRDKIFGFYHVSSITHCINVRVPRLQVDFDYCDTRVVTVFGCGNCLICCQIYILYCNNDSVG